MDAPMISSPSSPALKIFCLVMAVGMVCIRRACGHAYGNKSGKGSRDVDDAFKRVRQKRHRSGDPPCRCLEPQNAGAYDNASDCYFGGIVQDGNPVASETDASLMRALWCRA